jgi:lysophospholipase L1-like esterase
MVRTTAILLTLAGVGLLPGLAPGQARDGKANTATTPAPRPGNWVQRHEGFVARAKQGDVDVLLLGDSITEGWGGRNGKEVYQKHFAPLKAANFGISADRTQHVLWRIQNGELEGISPKVVMVMIGTNNASSNTPAEIAQGVEAIVKTLREKTPSAKILLLAVFPRAEKPDAPLRAAVANVNKIIAKLDDGRHVRYLDIGGKFLQPDGTLSKEIMPDFLHLSPRGYQIWAEAVMPVIHEMLGKKG